MSDIIRLLPDSVANQIAAGEVIQRPASVVKELVENSIDAGAMSVSIILKDAGRTLIQVVDNGSGMSATDARLAFERHSTSKITDAADLFSLHTMGFRGEALASICAVSQVELITMQKGESLGTKLVISGSKVELQEPCASTPGSNMSVRNLFFNVPARRKFLKKDSVELSNIVHEFERLALVNPDHDFELIHNETLIHKLLRGSLKQGIGQLFGKTVERQLIPIEVDTPIVKINGFIGLPENARKRNALQYFFVNGRNMRHPYFHKAVMSCYEQLIAADAQPNYFLSFTVDPSTIDVNIHPTKNEIKFENEQSIWQILGAAVRESLGKFNAVPSIEFDIEDSPEIPVFNPDAGASHGLDIDENYNPFAVQSKSTSVRSSSINDVLRQTSSDWEKLYEGFSKESSVGHFPDDTGIVRGSSLNHADDSEFRLADNQPSTLDIDDSFQQTNDVMQLKGRYIVSPAKSGLMVIDQHRAHVLILFEKYLAGMKNGSCGSQKVIFPEVIRLSASQNVLLDSMIDSVAQLGFELSFLGDNSWAINGVPSLMGKLNAVDTLMKLIENVADGGDVDQDDINRHVALSMAKASAIQHGKVLSTAEMESLMSELFSLPAPSYTPDGLTVVSIISVDEIANRF